MSTKRRSKRKIRVPIKYNDMVCDLAKNSNNKVTIEVNNGRKEPVVNTISDDACTVGINDAVINGRGGGDTDKNRE
ncbi:hypothetical protein Tco_0043172, partial [Tanacetum coccineum]